MNNDPVVFGAAVDGMRKALGKRITPAMFPACLALGIDFEKPQVAYHLDTWLGFIRYLATTLGEEVPEADRYRHLGRVFMQGFVETPIGFAALTAGKVLGVRRTLLRMGRNFKTASNYIETEFTEVGAKELRIRTFINDAFLPKVTDRTMLIVEYRQGVLEAVLQLVGGEGTVQIVDANPAKHDATFLIRWA